VQQRTKKKCSDGKSKQYGHLSAMGSEALVLRMQSEKQSACKRYRGHVNAWAYPVVVKSSTPERDDRCAAARQKYKLCRDGGVRPAGARVNSHDRYANSARHRNGNKCSDRQPKLLARHGRTPPEQRSAQSCS
jgi:hypothetical protein